MARLSDELRRLRRRLAAPLPELVADVERTIGVDIEVAARADRARVGRVHLDRFLDEAAELRGRGRRGDPDRLPGLPGRRRGRGERPRGRRGRGRGRAGADADRARGQGAGVGPGRRARPGRRCFPAEPGSSNWTRRRQLLPTPLRGDRADLPELSTSPRARPQAVRRTQLAATRAGEVRTGTHRGAAAWPTSRSPAPGRRAVRSRLRLGQHQEAARAVSHVPRRDPRPGRDRRVVRARGRTRRTRASGVRLGGDVAGRSARRPAPRAWRPARRWSERPRRASAGVPDRRATGRGPARAAGRSQDRAAGMAP